MGESIYEMQLKLASPYRRCTVEEGQREGRRGRDGGMEGGREGEREGERERGREVILSLIWSQN